MQLSLLDLPECYVEVSDQCSETLAIASGNPSDQCSETLAIASDNPSDQCSETLAIASGNPSDQCSEVSDQCSENEARYWAIAANVYLKLMNQMMKGDSVPAVVRKFELQRLFHLYESALVKSG